MEGKKSAVVDPCRLAINYGNCVACAACPSVCHTLALRMDALDKMKQGIVDEVVKRGKRPSDGSRVSRVA